MKLEKEQNINKRSNMRTELKNILSGNGIGFVKDAIGCVSLVLAIVCRASFTIILLN